MGRAPCCDKANVKRGPWSPDEDATLKRYLENHGTGGNWIALPLKAGLRRCGKSCRLRWLNYLRPDIKHGGFTEEEDNIIRTLYSQMGSRWSFIASQLPGRTDNDVKNYWNTKLKKKLLAGKTSAAIKINTTDSAPSKTSSFSPATPCPAPASLPCDDPKGIITNANFSDYSLIQSSVASLPKLSDAGYGQIVNTTESLNLDPFHFCAPGTMDMPEFGATSLNGQFVSSSQEGSSISDSSSLPMDNKYHSIPSNFGLEDAAGILMGSGFGFPCELVSNGLLLQEKASEVAPNSYPYIFS